jgi:CRP-like cAMP-binding protein
MRSLTEKLRATTSKRIAARSLDPATLLARTLHELAIAYGTPSAEGIVIDLPLTQADLGGLAAVAQSTAERILKDFRDQGILLSRYRQSVVLDLEALRRRAWELCRLVLYAAGRPLSETRLVLFCHLFVRSKIIS